MEERITYDIPPEFTDEEKWLKFFSTKQAKVFLATGMITVALSKICGIFGNAAVGAVTGIFFMTVCLVLVSIPIPVENYLKGGGLTLDIVLARRYMRWRNKGIYVLGYHDYADEEEKPWDFQQK